jgi:hypothetical protein
MMCLSGVVKYKKTVKTYQLQSYQVLHQVSSQMISVLKGSLMLQKTLQSLTVRKSKITLQS